MEMMRRFLRKRWMRTARHSLALTVLVSFAVANIGWPLPTGAGKCRAVAGKSTCCCNNTTAIGKCCCRQASSQNRTVARNSDPAPHCPTVKLASCCQMKKQTSEPVHDPAVKCACGDSPFLGFVVSSQPRLQTLSPRVPELAKSAFVPSPTTRALPQGSLSPETPPPRPSVA